MRKIYINNWLMVLAIFASILMTSCKKEDNVEFKFKFNTDRLLSEKMSNTKLFYEAAVKAGFDEKFRGTEQFTYFALSDAAMQAALEKNGYQNVAQASNEFLTGLLNDHTVKGAVTSGALSKGEIESISGKKIYVSITSAGDVVLNAKATVTDADNVTNNGVVHVIDYPLLSFPSKSIADIVKDTANSFKTLNAALQFTGLDQTLGGSSTKYTLFAPTDNAFARFGLDESNITQAFTKDRLTDILKFHVLEGRNFTMDFSSGRYFTIKGNADAGERGLDIEAENDQLTLQTANGDAVTTGSVNMLATNGTIQPVDLLLIPEPYIFDIFGGGYNITGAGYDGYLFNNFYTALNNSTFNFDSLLSSEKDYTVFTTNSFDSNLPEPTLTNTLKNQIFEGKVNLSESAGTKITSINGAEYYVTVGYDGYYYLNGTSLPVHYSNGGDPLVQDYSAYNGLITGFGGTALTPLPDTLSAASAINNGIEANSLFAGALKFLGLDKLKDATYLEVPNNVFADAYAAAGVAPNVAALDSADVSKLEELVNAQILTKVVFYVDTDYGSTYTDRNGNTVTTVYDASAGAFGFKREESGVITIINFTAVDVLYSDGVVHQVDGPLYSIN